MMWGNIVQPVEKATVSVTSVKFKTALMSMSKESKESQGRARKMGAYLKYYCSFCACN